MTRTLQLSLVLASLLGGGVAADGQAIDALKQRLETASEAERLALLNETASLTSRDSPRESVEYGLEAVELAGRLGDSKAKVDALKYVGVAHYSLAEYAQALEHYSASFALAQSIGYQLGIANALNNIGTIHYVWGEYELALEHYSRAMEMRREIGDREGLAKAYNNLGNVYYAAGRYEEALEHSFEAVEIYDELGLRSYVASTLNNIGLIYHRLERYDDALEQLRRAQAIEEGTGDRSGLALSLNNLGMVYEMRAAYAESLEYYQRALDIRRDLDDRHGIAIGLHNVGVIHARIGDFERSLELLHASLALTREIGLREIERDAYHALSETYEMMEERGEALEFHKLYKEANDRLFDEEISRRLAELQTRHGIERKDREIEVLRKTQEIQRIVRNFGLGGLFVLSALILLLYNRFRLKVRAEIEMRRANEAMQLAETERERAARAELAQVSRVSTMGEASALAHELNQPLTAILANAQATRRLIAREKAGKLEVSQALDDIVEGAGRAREIIKRMRELIRRGEITREPLDLNEILQAIETDARADASKHGVQLVMELDSDLPLIEGDRIQLQQVVLNLVRNGAEAMSGVVDEDDRLIVRTTRHDSDQLCVAVRDAGRTPADDELIQRMFDPFFTTKRDGMGMGLPICSSIIEAHDGDLWVTQNPDRGLTVQFTLPAKEAESESKAESASTAAEAAFY